MQIYEVTDQRFRKYGRVLDTPSLTGEVRKGISRADGKNAASGGRGLRTVG